MAGSLLGRGPAFADFHALRRESPASGALAAFLWIRKKEKPRTARAAGRSSRSPLQRRELATLLAPASPRTRNTRKSTAKIAASTLAMANDVPATPVKPSSAATNPITRNVKASLSTRPPPAAGGVQERCRRIAGHVFRWKANGRFENARLHATGSSLRLRRPGAAHLRKNHGAAPRQAPCRLRQRRQRNAREARRRARRPRQRQSRRPGEGPRLQSLRARPPLAVLAEPLAKGRRPAGRRALRR